MYTEYIPSIFKLRSYTRCVSVLRAISTAFWLRKISKLFLFPGISFAIHSIITMEFWVTFFTLSRIYSNNLSVTLFIMVLNLFKKELTIKEIFSSLLLIFSPRRCCIFLVIDASLLFALPTTQVQRLMSTCWCIGYRLLYGISIFTRCWMVGIRGSESCDCCLYTGQPLQLVIGDRHCIVHVLLVQLRFYYTFFVSCLPAHLTCRQVAVIRSGVKKLTFSHCFDMESFFGSSNTTTVFDN